MYARLLDKPSGSVFLFGPRGTGKSTWLRDNLAGAVTYDLLDSGQALRLEKEPQRLFHELRTLSPGSWVVLDEVQKVPALLDEVHRLIESQNLRFVLCGSSARKLKRTGVNLLAGRAVVTNMFPLVSAELGADFDIGKAVVHGTLPLAVTGPDPIGFLTTYAETYLNEEIRAEALTRSVGAFSRFLEVAARQNGQVTNVSGIARDAAVSRSTVQNYFDILVDTLIGSWLHPWKLKRATRQVSHPKFYLFDPGVARALTGRLPYPPTQEELGPLLETLILNEIRAYLEYRRLRYRVHYWRSYEGVEVDFLCETTNGFVAVEIKAAREWQNRFNRGLRRIRQELAPAKVAPYGVCLCGRRARFEDILVFPAGEFLDAMWKGEIIS